MTTTGSAVMRLGRWRALVAAAGALGLTACGRLTSGSGGGAGGTDDQGSGDGGPGGSVVIEAERCLSNQSFAEARISLIADTQFANAVRDIFGVQFEGDVTTGPNVNGEYAYNENATVSIATVQAYLTAADQVASKLKPCGASPVDAACMEPFLRKTLPRAWRRPVAEDEIAGIMALFRAGLEISADRAIKVTIEAILTSGSFLYRSEIGENAAAVAGAFITLTPHELASAVSFALVDSVPDIELDAKAADGSLTQPAVLSAEVDRLLAMPVVAANLQKKVSYYLGLEKLPFFPKDPTLFPQYASLQSSLYQGAQKFLSDVMWQGHFSDLYTSHRVYANQQLAAAYDIPGVLGAELVAVDFPGDQRGAGILTQPAFLAATNFHAGTDDIVHRGLYVYNSLACGIAIANPPPNEDAVFQTLTGTEREKALKRDTLGSCGACHNLFDPFGLVSESYDPIGRYRSTDPQKPGIPIDTSAVIQLLGPDLDGPVSGLPTARLCISQKSRWSTTPATNGPVSSNRSRTSLPRADRSPGSSKRS
jgi:hypothetical protein